MIVYPSGGDFATWSAPTPPPAPGLFSTTIGCPSAVDSFSPIVRARMSVVPPGANGTTHLIGFDGHGCAATAPAMTASTRPASVLRTVFIALLLRRLSGEHRRCAGCCDPYRRCGRQQIR